MILRGWRILVLVVSVFWMIIASVAALVAVLQVSDPINSAALLDRIGVGGFLLSVITMWIVGRYCARVARGIDRFAFVPVKYGTNLPRAVVTAALAVLLVVGVTCHRAAAADAQVRTVITNGGKDVGGKAEIDYFTGGHEGNRVDWCGSGETVKLPAGTYDVHVIFGDDAAHKDFWIDNQNFSGTVEKTVELNLPIAAVRYLITNGGKDVKGQAEVDYFSGGHEGNRVGWSYSNETTRLPAGTYDVHIMFNDDSAHKDLWIDNQKFSGTVQKTVELGQSLADVRYLVTNGGKDVKGQAEVDYFSGGHQGNRVGWSYSNETTRLPAGNYDVHVIFNDGSVHKDLWIDNQKFSDTVRKTVELGQSLADVRYLVTNGGKDVKGEAEVDYFSGGHQGNRVGWSYSNETSRLPAGNYDVHVIFIRGFVRKELWFDHQAFSGTVQKTVELGLSLAEPTVTVTQKGVALGDKARVAFVDPAEGYQVGEMAGGESAVLEAGTYDIRGSTFQNGVTTEAWLRKVKLAGRQHLTIELQKPRANLKVTVLRGGKPLAGAWCGAYPPNSKAEALGRANSGAWQTLDPATYDIGCFYAEGGITESAWLRNHALKPGKTALTLNLPSELASLTVTATRRSGGATAHNAAAGPNIEFILDASGSMVSHVDKTSTRMQVAKAVLSEALSKLPDKDVNVALRIYGTQPKARHDCKDSRLAVPLSPVNKQGLEAAVAGVEPSGWTPIAVNLAAAAKDLPKGGTNALVLITDGLESCGGDPCAVAAKLAAQGIVTRSFVVGFTLNRDRGRLMQCIGHYYSAQNRAQLADALHDIVHKALAPPIGTVTLTTAKGTLAAQGPLGQKLSVRAGRYNVRIASGSTVTSWNGLQIKGDMVKSLADRPH